jgi:phenylalanyl-tRNA synthetase beta chain
MKYSYFRLKELTKTKKTPEQLMELLTMKAFEVEGVEKIGEGLDNVVVGKILEIRKHPNADKLQIAIVDVAKEKLQIVCGAPNIAVGQKVPVALVGAKLPNGLEIKEAEIRGVKSFGMICAEDELGLGKDHAGILVLDADAKVGASFAKEMWLEDAMLDIKVLPDRSHDALSHVGMAREICALEGRKLAVPENKLPKAKKFNGVKIKDKKLASRYIGVVMENIKIQSSPVRYQLMLQKFCNNAINNIVDVTNVVMLEQGQPMHAFDYEKLSLPVSVRSAKKGEKIKLLDEKVYELNSEDIVIADAKGAIALAGVMGGWDSAVSESTNKILLEAAHFAPEKIRRTRTRLGIKTDASDRFEKGISPELAEQGMSQAVSIIQMMGGKVTAMQDEYPGKAKPKSILLSLEYVKKLLGIDVPEKEIKNILENLGCKAMKKGKGFSVLAPSVRLDLQTPEDLIEDIGRIFGYEKIKPVAPIAQIQPAKMSESGSFEWELKNILSGAGFSEVLNYSFYSRKDAELVESSAKHLELSNPMNPDQELVRTNLISGILRNVAHNLKYQKNLKIFESGRVFVPGKNVLPEEKRMLVGAVVLEGKEGKKGTSFFEAKGIVHSLLEGLGIDEFYYDSVDSMPADVLPSFWHQGRTAEVKKEGTGESIGFVGEVSPLILSEFDVQGRVTIFEFDLETLMRLSEEELEYAPIRRFPISERDISMVSEKGTKVDDLLQVIQSAGGKMVLNADLFDIYDFEDGSTSFAFHILFGADDRTLQSAEVDALMAKISESLEKDLKVKIRK